MIADAPEIISSAHEQLASVISAIFEQSDIVEVRWFNAHGEVKQHWLTASELKAAACEVADTLAADNAQGWNVYFGVNPRKAKQVAGDESILVARASFADIDDADLTVEQVIGRIENAGLPSPSIIVFSGHGWHVYWSMSEFSDLKAWRDLQADLSRLLGSDPKVKNPERVMRLPGFDNHKPGKPVVKSALVDCEPGRRYEFSQLREIVPQHPKPTPRPAPRHGSSDDDRKLKRCLAYVAKMPRSIQGQNGSDRMLQVGCETQRFALSDQDAMHVMRTYNSTQADPQWSEKELVHKLQSAKEKVTGAEVGSRLREDQNGQDVRQHEPRSRDVTLNYDLPTVAKQTTDMGNAARFVIKNGNEVRFCTAWHRWLCWNGKRWERDERNGILRLAKQTVLDIFREVANEPDDARREKLSKHAVSSQKRDRINAMIELAKSELSITPNQLDANPWLLNTPTGTVNLQTGLLFPHEPANYITKITGAAYDIDAKCPAFNAFLSRIFRQHLDLIAYVRKVFGYAATGLTKEQALFFCYGHGANGKSTLLDAIMYALGDYAGKADRDLLIANDAGAHPTNIADLMGRRCVVCSETDDGRRFDEGKLKDLVGETRIKARFMRGDFFEFDATHKLFLYSNHRPLVRGQDHGFWRRMRVISFTETIGEAERDTSLPDKLRSEAAGILSWIIGGCLLWQREGMGLPDQVANATEGYRGDMDSIGAFLSECCLFDARLEARAADLYAAYKTWCDDAGERPLSQKRLGMNLTERCLKTKRDSYTDRKVWIGIGLKGSENRSEI